MGKSVVGKLTPSTIKPYVAGTCDFAKLLLLHLSNMSDNKSSRHILKKEVS
jgi:hypothetical protein